MEITSSSAGSTKVAEPGYPALASLMAQHPETAIFRGFRELNMLNLLRLQAEINDLEGQLRDVRGEDASSGDADRAVYASDFRLMRSSKEIGDPEQYETLLALSEKLVEYNNSLWHVQNMAKSASATSRDLHNLKDWLRSPTEGNQFLTDREADIYQNSNQEDLITLAPPDKQQDPFTSFIEGRLLDAYHLIWGHRRGIGISNTTFRDYGKARLERLSRSISAVVASLLPTLAILILYFIQRMLVRIGLVIVFTSMFSLALAFFTAGSTAEIFAATAAFAAVEVVFIGSTNTTGSKTTLTAIEYNFASADDYQIYRIPQAALEEVDTSSHRNVRQHEAPQRNPAIPRRPRIPQQFRKRRPPPRPSPRDTSEEAAIQRRRFIYKNNLFSAHVGTNRTSQFRDFTPHTFARSKELQLKARKWIRRELEVFEFLTPSLTSSTLQNSDHHHETQRLPERRRGNNAPFLLEYLISILKTVDIKDADGRAENLLDPFLGIENARLFLHELGAWLRSPYSELEAWDRHVQY
ncbi:MAG: hypothetical protein Q9159_007234 [Coniocarpon cinnabarinum]